MTIVSTTVSISYAGDGSSTSFSVPFIFFGPDEIGVYAQTAAGVQTTLTRGVDYSVTGGSGSTGSIVMNVAPASGSTLIIRRRTARTQQVDYTDYDPFPAGTHEGAVDRLTAQTQETDESINRTIRKPFGTATINALPVGTGYGQFLSFDVSGNPIYATPASSGVAVSSAMQPLLAAASLPAFWALTGEIQGYSTTYGQFRLVGPTNYGVILKNDDTAFYILATASGAKMAGWTTLRPYKFFLSTGAVSIDETGAGTTFGGKVTASGTVATAFEVTGSRSRGLDLSGGSYSDRAIKLGNLHGVGWLNAAGSASIYDTVDGSNYRLVGSGAAGIALCATTIPITDNTYSLGTGSNRYTAVYAVNGTIQTSDPRLKVDVQTLPDALPLVLGIAPITFRWAEGGLEPVTEMETRRVQAVEQRTAQETVIELRDGTPVQVTRTVVRVEPLFDAVPVVDEAGDRVTEIVPAEDELRDAHGNQVRPARPARIEPVLHQVPRMVDMPVPVERMVSRPGRRTHWGFRADEVGRIMAETGRDFGGYVRMEDGTEGLRPDQLVPVLWKAMQELHAQVEGLRARLEAVAGDARS